MSEAFLYESPWEQTNALTLAGRPLGDLVGEIRDLYLEDKRLG